MWEKRKMHFHSSKLSAHTHGQNARIYGSSKSRTIFFFSFATIDLVEWMLFYFKFNPDAIDCLEIVAVLFFLFVWPHNTIVHSIAVDGSFLCSLFVFFDLLIICYLPKWTGLPAGTHNKTNGIRPHKGHRISVLFRTSFACPFAPSSNRQVDEYAQYHTLATLINYVLDAIGRLQRKHNFFFSI